MNLILSQKETMSHKEIAKLTGSREDTVKLSISRLEEKGIISFTPLAEKNTGGRPSITFYVNERDSYIVVAQLSPEFTAFLVDEWQKRKANSLPDFNNPAIAARAWADEVEAKQVAEQKIIEQAPKVEFVNRFIESTGNKSFREVAKILKANEREFRAFLISLDIMYRLGKQYTAYQRHVDAGRFHVSAGEKNGHAFSSCKFTPKGIEYVAGKWITRNQDK